MIIRQAIEWYIDDAILPNDTDEAYEKALEILCNEFIRPDNQSNATIQWWDFNKES